MDLDDFLAMEDEAGIRFEDEMLNACTNCGRLLCCCARLRMLNTEMRLTKNLNAATAACLQHANKRTF